MKLKHLPLIECHIVLYVNYMPAGTMCSRNIKKKEVKKSDQKEKIEKKNTHLQLKWKLFHSKHAQTLFSYIFLVDRNVEIVGWLVYCEENLIKIEINFS